LFEVLTSDKSTPNSGDWYEPTAGKKDAGRMFEGLMGANGFSRWGKQSNSGLAGII
jgi:hypothetical protein